MSAKSKDGNKMPDLQTKNVRNAGVDSAISSKLRSFYNGIAEESIPERFIELLEKLDAAERAAQATDGRKSDDK
jgi:Anti-sigma factor NepR